MSESNENTLERFQHDFATRVIAFRRTLTSESDRGVGLMAAAFLDSELKALLEFFLVEDEAIHKRYFGYGGPGGTFSGRIDSAYLLGLISKCDHRNLTIIRKVRNDFAHVEHPITFETEPIRARCLALSWIGDQVEASPRRKFIRSAMAISSSIHSAYVVVPICAEREHRALRREDEADLMTIANRHIEDVISGRVDYGDVPALARRMLKDIERRHSKPPDDQSE